MSYLFGKLCDQGISWHWKNDVRSWFKAAKNFFFTPDSNRTLIWHCLITGQSSGLYSKWVEGAKFPQLSCWRSGLKWCTHPSRGKPDPIEETLVGLKHLLLGVFAISLRYTPTLICIYSCSNGYDTCQDLYVFGYLETSKEEFSSLLKLFTQYSDQEPLHRSFVDISFSCIFW